MPPGTRCVPYAVSMPTVTAITSATAPLVVALTLCVVMVAGETSARAADPALPTMFARYLDMVVKPSAGERRRLHAGEPVTKLLGNEASEQVSVFGAIWINAPMQRYVEAIRNIETWEQGKAFHITRRISVVPTLSDFDGLRLRPDLVEDLRTCRPADCAVKLDAATMEAFQKEIDWTSPDRQAAAERRMREFLLEYSRGYLAGGNERLGVFNDKAVPMSMAVQFRAMLGELPLLTTFMPDMHEYLLGFPRVSMPGTSSFLYWQETEFGLKPTIRLSHLTIREWPDQVAVASKMIYATHYFRSALELRVLLPDPERGPGFWFVTLVSSRTDGMTGFTGLFVRRRVRNEARDATGTVLINTRRRIESAR
jgi:hypothetical protein